MKYVFSVLAVIFVVVLAIVLITRGDGNDGQRQQQNRPVDVSEQNKEGTSVQLTTQGRLVGETERRAIRVTINQEERRLEILTGYEEAVERSQVYPNTPAAYETFLTALQQAGFAAKRPGSTDGDETASCPLGKRYIYEVKEFSQDLSRLWGTSCGAKQGNFNGRATTIQAMFRAQIPEYNKQVSGVRL